MAEVELGRARGGDGSVPWWTRLRVLALVDIAGAHAFGFATLGGFGLSEMLVLSVALAARRFEDRTVGDVVRSRWQRLVVPWLVWCVVIGAYVSLRAWHRDEPLPALDAPTLLAGPMIHLWFLPFAAVAGVAAHGLVRATRRAPAAWIAAAALSIAAAAVMWLRLRDAGHPYERWGFSIPAVALGAAVGRIVGDAGSFAAARRPLSWLGVAWVAACAVGAGLAHDVVAAHELVRYGAAAFLTIGALWLPRAPDPLTTRLESLALGAYVLHFPVIQQVIARTGGTLPVLAAAVATVVVSYALAAALGRVGLRRLV